MSIQGQLLGFQGQAISFYITMVICILFFPSLFRLSCLYYSKTYLIYSDPATRAADRPAATRTACVWRRLWRAPSEPCTSLPGRRTTGLVFSFRCCGFPCNHCSNWTWVVEEILGLWDQAAFYALQGVQLFETMQTRLLHQNYSIITSPWP